MRGICILFSTLISVVTAQTDDSLLNDITLPPDLQKYYNEAGLANTKDKYMEMFKKKCDKNGHPEAYNNVQDAVFLFTVCMGNLINMDTIQEEIELAKPNGKVDEVFKKYCNKSPEFKTCLQNLTDAVKPCFSVEEQKNFKTLHNITDQLLQFICYKDGDRIALFISEGGVECFQSKTNEVLGCLNVTFDQQTQNELQNYDIDDFLNINFKEKQCKQMNSLQKCVVGELEYCTKPTSANIVESLFNFIRKSTPCKEFKPIKAKKDNGANGLAITSGALFVALAVTMIA